MGQDLPPARVITVSASYGAGGSVIAPQLAQRLGLAFADRLIPAKEGAPTGAGAERVTEAEERQNSRGRFVERLALLTGGLGLPVPSADDLGDAIRPRVEASIHQVVDAGGGLILGRAAAVVLARQPGVFHVRLHGPQQQRIRRGMAIEHIDEATARSRLTETDKARDRYIKGLYGKDAADPDLYHLVLDSTAFAITDCVDLLVAAATSFWAPSGAAQD